MKSFPGAPTYAVRPLKMKKDSFDKLVKELLEDINKAIGHRESEKTRWKLWIEQANSRRKRTNAGPKDAKIDIGITGEYIQALKARLMNPIFMQDQIFVCVPRRPSFEDTSKEMELLLDQICDRAPMMQVCNEWLDYGLTLPFGVVKTHFVNETTIVRKWSEVQRPEPAEEEETDSYGLPLTAPIEDEDSTSISVSGKTYVEEEVEIVEKQGAFPEVIPSEDFLFPPSAVDVRSADWVAHRVWLTKKDIETRVARGYFDKKIDGEDTVEALGEPSGERERMIKPLTSSDKDKEPVDEERLFEILEVYTSVEKVKGYPEEIILFIDRNSGKVLKSIYNPYHTFQRPFVTWSYKKLHGSISGLPLTYVLEPIHVAYSASVCQRLDAASKANEILLLVRTGSDVKKIFDNGIVGGVWDIADDPKDVQQFQLSVPFTQLPELENRFLMHADKAVGMSDYLRGIEQVDRPTATGQVSLIEEAKQQFFILLESFRASLAEVALHMLARYKQFFPAGLELYIQSSESPLQFISWPDAVLEESVLVETKVSSGTMSKMMRKQEVMALVDKMPQLYQTMMGLAQQAIMPSPISPTAAKLLQGFQLAVDKFMTEFEISKKEYLNPDLMGDIQIGQYMAQMQMQIQQMGQQMQQMGMGGGNPQGQLPGQSGPQPPVQGSPNPNSPPQGQMGY